MIEIMIVTVVVVVIVVGVVVVGRRGSAGSGGSGGCGGSGVVAVVAVAVAVAVVVAVSFSFYSQLGSPSHASDFCCQDDSRPGCRVTARTHVHAQTKTKVATAPQGQVVAWRH